ncbi:unnamed protein product [Miscanthus lutarioriparius]|uniref:Uncharacterized protein n=1 Tax=Miscanthus lutarioriparius TaxID=422564 RepID=A0A811RQJ2_9POAL|nr:unnamed protein product [Miscanthus lutarioriparius]
MKHTSKSAIILMCWTIWGARNDLLFSGISPNIQVCKTNFRVATARAPVTAAREDPLALRQRQLLSTVGSSGGGCVRMDAEHRDGTAKPFLRHVQQEQPARDAAASGGRLLTIATVVREEEEVEAVVEADAERFPGADMHRQDGRPEREEADAALQGVGIAHRHIRHCGPSDTHVWRRVNAVGAQILVLLQEIEILVVVENVHFLPPLDRLQSTA